MSNKPGAPATRAFRIDPFIIALLIAAALGLLLPARGTVATIVDILKTAAIALLFFLQGVRLERAAVISGIIAVLWRKSVPSAIVLGTTLLASLVFAGVVGFSIPLVLRLGQRDPKIAAGPIALAIVDVLALLFYFTLAKSVLP